MTAEATVRTLTDVVEVCGEADVVGAERLRVRLEEALAARPARLVVDLSSCSFIDATALGVLLEAHRAARRAGVALVLRGVGARVERLLALTGMTGVFALEATG